MHAEPRHRHAAAGQRLSAGQGRPELLDEIAHWHTGLAEGFVACHPGLAASALNDVVQRTIVGIVFLWMCEERGGEPRGQLRELCDQPGIMPRLGSLLHAAARRYHAGVFPSIPINGGAPYLLQSVDEPLRMLVAALAEGGQRTGAYHFPTSLLGQVYERLQQQELSRGADGQLVVNNRAGQRKRSGVYYTPEDVVDDIVAHTLGKLLTERGALAGALSAAARGHLRVMDPACGAGVFLLRAYRRLAEWHLDWYQRHNPERWATARAPPIRPSPHRRRSCAAWQLTISEKGRILRDCVFGVDLDQHAVEVTKLGLLLELLAGESHETLAGTTQSGTVAELPNLAHNIHWGNALLGPDFWTDRSQADGGDVERRRTRTFDWRAAFPAVFSADRPGFDVIIGNPPYRNGVEGRTRFDARCRAYFRRKYVAARGAIDASILFQELGLRLLADGGWTALLVPNKFLAAPFGQAFRHLALEQAELRVLADYAQAKVFPGVATYPVAYVLQKTATPRAEYDLYTERHARRDRAIVCSESRVVRMRPEQWETWTPAFSRNAGLLEQLERRGACIAEHFRVTASATAGEAYLLRPFLKDGRPRGRAYRFVTTGIIDRYGDRLGRVPLRYLKASYRHPYLPADCHALTANRRRQYAAEKLIVAGLARRLKATWDDGATAGAVSTVQVWHYSPRKAASLMYLLALLNSRLLTWVFRQHFAALSLAGGYMRIGLRQISALPLPCLDLAGRRGQAAHDQLERLAVRMIGLHARLVAAATPRARASLPGRIDATDREIDRRVYALYGLTAKQVQLVEQETATPTATGQPAVGA